MRKAYWVYILRCSDGSYYTGSTSNLEKRISEHQNGLIIGYTSKRLPVKIVFSEYFDDVYFAISAERQIKRWKRVKKKLLLKGILNYCINWLNVIMRHIIVMLIKMIFKPDGSTPLTMTGLGIDQYSLCLPERSRRIASVIED